MESIDPIQAQRVWQRVQGRTAPPQPGALVQLLALEQEAACIYRQLSRLPALRENRTLSRLREENHRLCRSLLGLARLQGRKPPAPTPSIRGSAQGLLELAWGQRVKSLALLAQEPEELTPVLPALEEAMQRHALTLAALACELGDTR